MFTHIDLFAGIGGFSLGFQNAGFITVACVEKDEAARGVLKYHHPNIIHLDDVCTAGKHNLPYADVITFGSPCQDLSVAGNRKGLIGERSGLFWEAIRIIDELKPHFAVWENVPGALSSNSGRDFAAILGAFRDIGARDIAWRILDAQYFGVAQRRRRVFVVADFRGECAAEILFESESLPGDFESSRTAGQEVAREPGESVESDSFQRSDQYIADTKTGALAARDFKSAKDLIVGTLAASGAGTARPAGQANELDFLIPVQAIDLQQVTSAENRSRPTPESPPLTPKQRIVAIDVRNSRSNGEISGTLQAKSTGGYSLNYINPIAFQWNAGSAASLNPSEVSPTMQVKHPPAVNDANCGVRRLTPVECARLQGFPDLWAAVNGQSDTAQYRQYGNAVAVPVAEWIGNRVMQVKWKAFWHGISKDIKEEVA